MSDSQPAGVRALIAWLVPLVMLLARPQLAAAEEKLPPSMGRPYEAPLLAPKELPPDPPEYLKHNAAGVRFSYHPSARERVRQLIEDAELVRGELAEQLGRTVLARVWVRVAIGSSDYDRLLPEDAPRGTSIVALSPAKAGDDPVLALRLGAPGTETNAATRASFRRGMAYLGLDEAGGTGGMPRWLRTGYAVSFSREAELARARTLWWGSMDQRVIPLVVLDFHMTEAPVLDSMPIAEASDFVNFLLDDERAGAFAVMMGAHANGASFQQGLRQAYQADLSQLEGVWRKRLARHKAFVPVLLGSTALWLLVALGAKLRKRRRAREPEPEPEETLLPAVRRGPRSVRIVHLGGRPMRAPDDDLLDDDDYDEVPKVSHNGRWHTLH